MHKILAALVVGLLVAAPVAADERADVMAPVNQFINGFNKGDIKTALTACAEQTSIIDEFPPYEWHGAGACAAWAKDFDADAKKNGITDGVVTLGTPLHVDVDGSHAYVVIPSTYAFKLKGKAVKETGSLFTFAMLKGPNGWRIVGWSWAKNHGPA